MSRTVCLILLVIATAVLASVGAEVNAACPTPTCATSGDESLLDGTFGCTLVSTASSGLVTVSVIQLNFDGLGDVSSAIQTTNKNAASGTTFVPWTSLGAGTYCINTDQTGYIFPATGCPMAYIVDTALTEIRTLDSTQNLASTAVCEITE